MVRRKTSSAERRERTARRRAAAPIDEERLRQLGERLGTDHLATRLALQADPSLRRRGHGRARWHIENLPWLLDVAALLLRASGLGLPGRRHLLDLAASENALRVPGWPTAWDGLRILHLADLHLCSHPDLARRIALAVRGQRFDLCAITGDVDIPLVPDQRVESDLRTLIAALACPLGVYGILGNHDWLQLVPLLEAMGVRLLLNEAVSLPRGGIVLRLAGVDDPHLYGTHDLERALHSAGEPNEEPAARVLLAHSPEIVPEAAASGFQVYLTGHTHGGQLCLPGGWPIIVNARCSRRLVAGVWREGQMVGYTSRGIGTSNVPARLFCPPEIVIHTLLTA